MARTTFDAVLVQLAFAAGALSFFSPCSVGLLPAYIGFFLGAKERDPAGEVPASAAAVPPPPASPSLFRGTLYGAGLGLAASMGFFSLFLGLGAIVYFIGTNFLAPYLVWISRIIGVAIILLGLLVLLRKGIFLTPRLRFTPTKSAWSIFGFGIAYALASLGCSLPIFLYVVLSAFSASSPLYGLLTLIVYALGMATLMVSISALLGASRQVATDFLRRVVPYVKVASGFVMIVAGGYILYYYTVVIVQ